MTPRPTDEAALDGGTANRGLVVRVADTVRRPQSPASPAVHALLRHLEAVGFEGAPRYLGQDDNGREVLSYIEGDVPLLPTPSWALTEDALASVASLLRRYHEAVASFDPTPYPWRTPVPTPYRTGLVTHNDPNLDNVVFRDGEAVALIDFDLAGPGSVVWDVALAARLWVPLRAPEHTPAELVDDVAARLRFFAEAYGLAPEIRRSLALVARDTHLWSYAIVRAGVEEGHPGYADYWRQGGRDRDALGRRWIEQNLATLMRALA